MLETVKKIPSKEEFHREKFFFSYSSLVKLINNPKQFYKDYILKEREDSDEKFLKEGELFHCFVLEPEMFDEKFVVMSAKVPGGGLKDIIDTVYNTYAIPELEKSKSVKLEDFSNYILKELEAADLYQSYTDSKRADKNGLKLTGDEKRLEKCITYETEEYFRVLCESTRKKIVDMDMVSKAKEKANIVLEDEQSMFYLTKTNTSDQVEKEVELKCDLAEYKFGLKGVVDCVKIDNEEKIIYITDLKTTSKTLNQWYKNFDESEYMYWLQVVVYKELIKSLIKPDELKYWKVKINFTVIDKNNDVYNFPVSFESMQKWSVKTKEKLDIANWHYTNHEYTLPFNYATNNVKL